MLDYKTILVSIGLVISAYLFGSVPMGYLVIKLFKRQDITQVGSGRTGGTNAMRAGGIWMGLITGVCDLLKGSAAIWFARAWMPGSIWIQVLAGAAAVFGHNWSIWLYLITKRLDAGAGTGPNVGAAIAFYPPVALVVVPIVLFFVFVVGYASLASIAAALTIVVVLFIRAAYNGMPWQYGIYGLMTTFLVMWALRPNIKRLFEGTERRVGFFAKKAHLKKAPQN